MASLIWAAGNPPRQDPPALGALDPPTHLGPSEGCCRMLLPIGSCQRISTTSGFPASRRSQPLDSDRGCVGMDQRLGLGLDWFLLLIGAFCAFTLDHGRRRADEQLSYPRHLVGPQ